jgi:phosphoribosylformylglycinamidine cyclo-ligase
VCGARPLFMTDYIACGRVVPERIAAIVRGIAAACEQAGCALVGGETAEHPGLLDPDEYDVAGAATGVVEAGDLLGPHRVRAGDVLVGLASTGLHSNGFSLARRVLERAGWALTREVPELGRTIGEELLTPTRVYARDALALAATLGTGLHGFSHVTGGGLASNLARVLPAGLIAVADRSTWAPAPVFGLLARLGDVPADDVERTFNVGVGMVAVVAADQADLAVRQLGEAGVPAWVLGDVRDEDESPVPPEDATRGTKGVAGGAAVLVGDHP